MKRGTGLVRMLLAAVLVLVVAACAADAGQPSRETSDTGIAGSEPPAVSGDEVIGSAVSGDDEAGADVTSSAPSSETVAATVSPLSESEVDEGVVPEGFTTVMVEVTKADGEVCEVCVWLADTAAERGQGLMGVTSLGTPVGMAFVWEQPTAGAFYMFKTVTPLSIAWFGADGDLVSTADMDPCASADASECERFRADGPFAFAIEVVQGDLDSIGITDGSTARLLPGTEAVDCLLR